MSLIENEVFRDDELIINKTAYIIGSKEISPSLFNRKVKK